MRGMDAFSFRFSGLRSFLSHFVFGKDIQDVLKLKFNGLLIFRRSEGRANVVGDGSEGFESVGFPL